MTVDIGTTSVKLSLFDGAGEPRAVSRHTTPTTEDQWGQVYDVDQLKHIVVGFIRGLDQTERLSVGRVTIAGVGESAGLVRSDLTLASPMILWHDHRGQPRLAELGEADRSLIYRITGLPVNANYGLSKVAWSVVQAGSGLGDAQWLNIAEYLAAWMTGQRWSERSLASRTMALNLTSRTWSPEVCALLGLDVGIFPELRDAADGSPVTSEFARMAALQQGVNVHVAGHDHMVGAVGAGLQEDELLNSTGTTEGILVLRDAPSLDEHSQRSKLANGLACQDSKYTLFASIPTGGSAFATLQAMLGVDAAQLSRHVDQLHERYVAGRVNLARIPVVVPHFRGAPPPTKRASARGVIAGLTSDTSTEEIVFGSFLGMVMQFRDVLDLFRAPITRIKVIGPASANSLWLQLKADLLRAQLSVSKFPEVVSRGAQALAAGVRPEWESCGPREIAFDDSRAAQLSEWCEENGPRWRYLQDVPA